MLDLITNSATYLFTGGRALKLIKIGVNISNSKNPVMLTKNCTRFLCSTTYTVSSSLYWSWCSNSNCSFDLNSKFSYNRFSFSSHY